MPGGHACLCAVIDWYLRNILARMSPVGCQTNGDPGRPARHMVIGEDVAVRGNDRSGAAKAAARASL